MGDIDNDPGSGKLNKDRPYEFTNFYHALKPLSRIPKDFLEMSSCYGGWYYFCEDFWRPVLNIIYGIIGILAVVLIIIRDLAIFVSTTVLFANPLINPLFCFAPIISFCVLSEHLGEEIYLTSSILLNGVAHIVRGILQLVFMPFKVIIRSLMSSFFGFKDFSETREIKNLLEESRSIQTLQRKHARAIARNHKGALRLQSINDFIIEKLKKIFDNQNHSKGTILAAHYSLALTNVDKKTTDRIVKILIDETEKESLDKDLKMDLILTTILVSTEVAEVRNQNKEVIDRFFIDIDWDKGKYPLCPWCPRFSEELYAFYFACKIIGNKNFTDIFDLYEESLLLEKIKEKISQNSLEIITPNRIKINFLFLFFAFIKFPSLLTDPKYLFFPLENPRLYLSESLSNFRAVIRKISPLVNILLYDYCVEISHLIPHCVEFLRKKSGSEFLPEVFEIFEKNKIEDNEIKNKVYEYQDDYDDEIPHDLREMIFKQPQVRRSYFIYKAGYFCFHSNKPKLANIIMQEIKEEKNPAYLLALDIRRQCCIINKDLDSAKEIANNIMEYDENSDFIDIQICQQEARKFLLFLESDKDFNMSPSQKSISANQSAFFHRQNLSSDFPAGSGNLICQPGGYYSGKSNDVEACKLRFL